MSAFFNATHLAVVSGDGDPGDLLNLSRGEFFGTAFPLGRGLFATAGHVYQDAAAYGPNVAIGTVLTNPPQIHMITDHEPFPGLDLAILQCVSLNTPVPKFSFTPLDYLDEVAALGFPFGMVMKPGGPHLQILRAFSGTVVTRRSLGDLFGSAPPGYEVTFVPPPGMSGAPLFDMRSARPTVCGIVIKEYTAELVHAPERKMTLGIALDLNALRTIESRLAGGSVAEKVFGRSRLPPLTGEL